MKNFIILIMVGLIAFVAYDYFSGGSLSEEEISVELLEKEFHSAVKSMRSAMRAAGATGMDTTGSLENAINIVKDVDKRLDELSEDLKTDSAIKYAEKLKASIDEFLEKNPL